MQLGLSQTCYIVGVYTLRHLKDYWQKVREDSLAPRFNYSSNMTPNQALGLFGFHYLPSQSALRRRYHMLARQCHPDKLTTIGGSSVCSMQELTEAYQILRC